MIKSHILGYPRMGLQRELKVALERHWRAEITEQQLEECGAQLRQRHWAQQRDAGLDFVTVGDFAYYDQVANHIELFGCAPARFGFSGEESALARYFTLARGVANEHRHEGACNHAQPPAAGKPALEMTKWFDTNYHYLVPEFDEATRFSLASARLLGEVAEAPALGHRVKPVLIGPLTFLWLGKSRTAGFDKLALLERLLPAYVELLRQLKGAGAEWVQIDEPILGLDLPGAWALAFERAYHTLNTAQVSLLLATYFSPLQEHLSLACKLPVAGLHVDLVRAGEELQSVIDWLPAHKVLSLGIVDGRNVWRADLDKALRLLAPVVERRGQALWIAPSCSLLHVPLSLSDDAAIDDELRSWLAGASDKLAELRVLQRAVNEGEDVVSAELLAARTAIAARAGQPAREESGGRPARRATGAGHRPPQQCRSPSARPRRRRASPCRISDHDDRLVPADGRDPRRPRRLQAQGARRGGVRTRRCAPKSRMPCASRRNSASMCWCMAKRSATTWWNTSANSSTVSPSPPTAGCNRTARAASSRRCCSATSRGRRPMTVRWTAYAQSLTERPMKGMLTGPITILQWSFVRDDQARSATAQQIALAIRDEVMDLEAAGIGIIQIDEPAIREGLPLRRARWNDYLQWAARAFRVAASGVADDTQVHTHMCYAEFNDILPEIAAMDADVITIETSRSDMELLRGFGSFQYPNEIGPGVYDIHSPQVPSVDDMVRLMKKAAEVIPSANLWVNPDCGLKTRAWPETRAALRNMVAAAHRLRGEGRGG